MQLQNAAGRLLKVGVGLYTGQGSTAGDAGYRETNALARVADEAGFDSFSVSEHHGGTTRTCRVRSCWLRWPHSPIGSNSAPASYSPPLSPCAPCL